MTPIPAAVAASEEAAAIPVTDVAVIIVAGGSGARLGDVRPKAFVAIRGRTILEHALDAVFSLEEPVHVVVVAPAAELSEARALGLGVAGAASGYLTVVAGGPSRQRSVACGLAAVGAERIVLVHDAARSFTPTTRFAAVIAAVRATGTGVIPVLPVTDTIKQADASGRVTATLDRSRLVTVQTPQGFPSHQLRDAYRSADSEHTDDASLFAAAGHQVTCVDGDPLSFKITTAWDIRRAEALVDGVSTPPGLAASSTGLGIDVHAFDDGQPLYLGGLFWPEEPGLSGHSDGDAVAHAICDALLSASRLGDIGSNFGTADPRFAGAHGEVFLLATRELLAVAGFAVVNVAVQVIANRPKLGPRRAEMEECLSQLVGAPVSVSATTTDGLGFAGRGDGLTAVATALVRRSR